MCAANNHSINAAFSRGRLQRHWRRRWPEPQLNVAHGCPTFLGKFFTYSDPEISRGRCVFCRGPFEVGRLRFLTASFNHRRPKRKIIHCLTGASTAVTSTIKKNNCLTTEREKHLKYRSPRCTSLSPMLSELSISIYPPPCPVISPFRKITFQSSQLC